MSTPCLPSPWRKHMSYGMCMIAPSLLFLLLGMFSVNIKTVLKESGHFGGGLFEPVVSIMPYGHNMDIMNDDFAGIPNFIECSGDRRKDNQAAFSGIISSCNYE